MENAEEVLQCLDEFAKMKPKDIPRELEDYLCFVAKTGDPVYQWPLIKCLFREKLVNVITEFYESCPTVEIPPCPNVEAFNYDSMKNFILEKLDTFAAAPFTVQRICELLTAPRKEYNRIDKYMRALEKNILVVSTREPGSRKSTENGESVVNGLESEHGMQDVVNSDVNVEVEMEETTSWPKAEPVPYAVNESNIILESQTTHPADSIQDTYVSESKVNDTATCSSSGESVITSRSINYIGYTPNITDLIIETSAVSNNSETGPTVTPMAVERENNITVFTMSNEYSVPAEQTQTEIIKEPEDPAGPTYEPTLVQIETSTISEPTVEPESSIKEQQIVPDSETPKSEIIQDSEPTQDSEAIEDSEVIDDSEAIEDSEAVSSETNQDPETIRESEKTSESKAVEESEQDEVAEAEAKVLEVPLEPEPSVPNEPEPSVPNEPESSSTEVQLQPESAVVYVNSDSVEQVESLCEAETNDMVISSTEQFPVNSTDLQPATEPKVPEIKEETSEDEVTESNIESEYVVSQTEEAVEPSEVVSTSPTEEPHQEAIVEKMQIDDEPTEPQEPQRETQAAGDN